MTLVRESEIDFRLLYGPLCHYQLYHPIYRCNTYRLTPVFLGFRVESTQSVKLYFTHLSHGLKAYQLHLLALIVSRDLPGVGALFTSLLTMCTSHSDLLSLPPTLYLLYGLLVIMSILFHLFLNLMTVACNLLMTQVEGLVMYHFVTIKTEGGMWRTEHMNIFLIVFLLGFENGLWGTDQVEWICLN